MSRRGAYRCGGRGGRRGGGGTGGGAGMVAGQSVVQEHDGGGGGGGGGMAYCSPIHSPYQGEYYPEYFVAGAAPPEMCPAHHMCTVHGDFGKKCSLLVL